MLVGQLEKNNMLPLILAFYVPPAVAHAESEGVVLHEGYDYDSCYIDLHSELTQSQLGSFGRKFTDAGAFMSMSGAESLGGGHVRLGLTYSQTFIDDAELMYTMDPSSNWGIGGVALRHAFLEQSETTPLSLAGRATYEHLIGPDEVNVDGAALESLVSHRFGVLSPFAGVGVTGSLGSEHTDELSLDPAFAWGARATAGLELNVGFFHAAAQGMWASVPSVALQLGGTI